jgi:hypothetical protein
LSDTPTSLRSIVVPLIAAAALMFGTLAYARIAGIVVQGTIVDKHETFEAPTEDTWRRVYEVTYRYQPLDSAAAETGGQRIDSALFSRLRVGSAVQVRYSPIRLMRPMEGVATRG